MIAAASRSAATPSSRSEPDSSTSNTIDTGFGAIGPDGAGDPAGNGSGMADSGTATADAAHSINAATALMSHAPHHRPGQQPGEPGQASLEIRELRIRCARGSSDRHRQPSYPENLSTDPPTHTLWHNEASGRRLPAGRTPLRMLSHADRTGGLTELPLA